MPTGALAVIEAHRDLWTPLVAQKAGDRRESRGRLITDQ
jgi:hypothetical protein